MKWSAICRSAGVALAAVALSVTGAVGASAANPTEAATSAADAPATEGQPVADVSSITGTAGTLNINKYTPTTDGTTRPNNGTAVDMTKSGAFPIEGVQFTVRQVTKDSINTTTNDGWKAINDLYKAVGDHPSEQELRGQGVTWGAARVQKTNENGQISLNNLPYGLYYVVETAADTDEIKIHKTDEVVTTNASSLIKSQPFLVTLPMTNPENHTEWMSTVNVYPKNAPISIKKNVADSTTPGTGNTDATKPSDITYTVDTPIPNVKSLKYFALTDQLDKRVTYKATSLKVSIQGDKSDTTLPTLEANTDYTVVVADATGVVLTDPEAKKAFPKGFSDQVSIVFTDAGRKKLASAVGTDSSAKVHWEFQVTVKDTTGKNDIANQAYVIPNNPNNTWNPAKNPTTPPPGTPSNKVVSKYGSVTITKTSTKKPAENLNGAEFELYVCDKQGHYNKVDNKVTVDNVNKWTTTDNGTVKIDGLQLNDFKNNSTEDEGKIPWSQQSYYCLVETKAPAGYELLPNPIKFQITQEMPNYNRSLKVKDVPSNSGFHLPLTGSTGIGLAVLAGLLMIGGSILYTVRVRRG